MREGKDKNIEFVVNIKNKDQHLWPSHLSAVYISDRISDIKKERKTEEVNVVITVGIDSVFSIADPPLFQRRPSRGFPERTGSDAGKGLHPPVRVGRDRSELRLFPEPPQRIQLQTGVHSLRGRGIHRVPSVRDSIYQSRFSMHAFTRRTHSKCSATSIPTKFPPRWWTA